MHDIGHHSAFALVNSVGGATSLVDIIGYTLTGIDTHKDLLTFHGVDIVGALKTHRTTSQGGTSVPNYEI